MNPKVANDVLPEGPEELEPPSGLLGRVDVPVQGANLALSSGRRYELVALPEGDRLTVRSRGGSVLLRVLMTESGPLLAFESADVELAATGRLSLSAGEISIDARRSLTLSSGGDCTNRVTGTRHTRIGAADRLEAETVQIQASDGAVELRAAGRIAINGDHVGLNDDPCPHPFEWSAVATGPESGA